MCFVLFCHLSWANRSFTWLGSFMSHCFARSVRRSSTVLSVVSFLPFLFISRMYSIIRLGVCGMLSVFVACELDQNFSAILNDASIVLSFSGIVRFLRVGFCLSIVLLEF